mgnify:CR=1 FL=1
MEDTQPQLFKSAPRKYHGFLYQMLVSPKGYNLWKGAISLFRAGSRSMAACPLDEGSQLFFLSDPKSVQRSNVEPYQLYDLIEAQL